MVKLKTQARNGQRQRDGGSRASFCLALLSQLFWSLPKELQMTALAALKSIAFDEERFESCARHAMSMPLEAVAPAKRANHLLAANLKLMWAVCFLDRGFDPALDCCDGLFHKYVQIAERQKQGRHLLATRTATAERTPAMVVGFGGLSGGLVFIV